MIGSMTDWRYNVAWRHPKHEKDSSLYDTISTCTHRSDGQIIVPGYGKPTVEDQYLAMYYMYWREGGRPTAKYPSGSGRNMWNAPCNPNSASRAQFPQGHKYRCENHGLCTRHQKW